MNIPASPFRLYLALASALAIVACVTIPETGESAFILTSPNQEAQMGASAFSDVKKQQKISKDPAANAQVKRVADRLIKVVNVPNAKWEVVVFEDDTPNAFALPGGKIGVNTGILPITQNDAGLAAVLGHELAHVTLRHGGQRVSQQLAVGAGLTALDVGFAVSAENYDRYRPYIMSGLGVGTQIGVTLPFSRSNEYEADRIGMRYMARAGYDPKEAIAFWQRMEEYSKKHGNKPPEWLSTHPADENRVTQLEKFLPEAEAAYQKAEKAPAATP